MPLTNEIRSAATSLRIFSAISGRLRARSSSSTAEKSKLRCSSGNRSTASRQEISRSAYSSIVGQPHGGVRSAHCESSTIRSHIGCWTSAYRHFFSDAVAGDIGFAFGLFTFKHLHRLEGECLRRGKFFCHFGADSKAYASRSISADALSISSLWKFVVFYGAGGIGANRLGVVCAV